MNQYTEDLSEGKAMTTRNREELIKLQIKLSQLHAHEEKMASELEKLQKENDFYAKKNADFEVDNANLNKEIQATIQKIDINYLLKEIDIEDLRLVAQNNKVMSSAIHNLIGKWESIAKIDKW